MDSPSFLNNLPGAERWAPSPWVTYMNKALAKFRSPVVLGSRFDHRRDMVSLEQIANFELLLSDLVERGVPGAAVELGCYMGSTAAVIGGVLAACAKDRPFHVYDRFDIGLDGSSGIRDIFEKRMRDNHVPMPIIHQCDILELDGHDVPENIAFAHIDLGVGGDLDLHCRLINHALGLVYPRLSKDGVVVIMDYHVPGVTMHGHDSNPGARIATDEFLKDKPEKPRLLYGGACSHAFIRKQ